MGPLDQRGQQEPSDLSGQQAPQDLRDPLGQQEQSGQKD
jgi:hypothetical protein